MVVVVITVRNVMCKTPTAFKAFSVHHSSICIFDSHFYGYVWKILKRKRQRGREKKRKVYKMTLSLSYLVTLKEREREERTDCSIKVVYI